MKKLFKVFTLALVGAVTLGFSACAGPGETNPLSVSPDVLTFSATAEAKTVTVAGESWTASVDQTWVTIDPASGTDGTITITVTANQTPTSRHATITVSNDTGSKTVSVQQASDPGEIFIYSEVRYYDEDYVPGLANIGLYFESIVMDGNVVLKGGHALTVDMFSPAASDPDVRYVDIPNGIYTVSADNEAFTVDPNWSGDVVVSDEGAIISQPELSSGTIEITGGDGEYAILFDLVLSDASILKGIYEGTIEIENPYYTGPIFDEPLDLTLGNGDLLFDSDDDTVSVWTLQAWTDGITLDRNYNFQGSGFVVMSEIYGTVGALKLPDGTYSFVGADDAFLYPFTVLEGITIPGWGNFGTWVIEMTDGDIVNQAPVLDGTVIVIGDTLTLEGEAQGGTPVKAVFSNSVTILEKAPVVHTDAWKSKRFPQTVDTSFSSVQKTAKFK